MAMSGSLMPRPAQIGDHTRMAIGPTLTSAGLGYRTKISVGPHITMVAGFGSRTTVGAGFPDMNGDRLGSHGEPAEIMSAGLRCLRRAAVKSFMKVGQSLDVPMSISESGLAITTSSMCALSANRYCAVTSIP